MDTSEQQFENIAYAVGCLSRDSLPVDVATVAGFLQYHSLHASCEIDHAVIEDVLRRYGVEELAAAGWEALDDVISESVFPCDPPEVSSRMETAG